MLGGTMVREVKEEKGREIQFYHISNRGCYQ
jgi:hypothetical protein